MEKNINPEINRLNMETSRNAADSLRGWAGLGSEKKPVASTFLGGSTAQMLKESQNFDISGQSKSNVVFSFGLINTVSALKNSSLVKNGYISSKGFEIIVPSDFFCDETFGIISWSFGHCFPLPIPSMPLKA